MRTVHLFPPLRTIIIIELSIADSHSVTNILLRFRFFCFNFSSICLLLLLFTLCGILCLVRTSLQYIQHFEIYVVFSFHPTTMASSTAELDYTAIGAVQLLISVLGCLFNVISFLYFKSLKSRSGNKEFFKRLYMIITLTDFSICLTALASVDAALSPDRNGHLHSGYLCVVWCLLWSVLPQVSIFLVGMLSVARLCLLRNIKRNLHPNVAVVLPLACFFFSVAVWAGLYVSEVLYSQYFQSVLLCSPSPFDPFESPQLNVTRSERLVAIWGTFLFNLTPGLSVIPISVSFVLSLLLLKQSRQLASSMRSSTKRHRDASKTVVIVTLVYLLCNTPYTVTIALKFARRLANLNGEVITREEYLDAYFALASGRKGYAGYVVTFVVLVSLNSVMNPIVYFWRVRHFRVKVLAVSKRIRDSFTPARLQAAETTL